MLEITTTDQSRQLATGAVMAGVLVTVLAWAAFVCWSVVTFVHWIG